MQRVLFLVLVLAFPCAAQARPGFYVGLGGGGAVVNGESGIGNSRIGADEQGNTIATSFPLSTNVGGGPAASFFLGFNVLGYGAIEVDATGHGTGLFDVDTRKTSWQLSFGLRGYPLWHWRSQLPDYLQPFEPSVFFGWGPVYEAYTPVPGFDPVGWSKMPGVLPTRFGLGVEYYVISYFRVGLDYAYVHAAFDNFIFNYDESLNFPTSPPAKTGIHQVIANIAFQFGSEQQLVRYSAPTAAAPLPAADTAPAPASEPPAPEEGPADLIDG